MTMVSGQGLFVAPPRWWRIARVFFHWPVIFSVWTAVAVTVGLAVHDGGVGVLAGFAMAWGFPFALVWPLMKRSARRRGVNMTLRRREPTG